MDKPGSLPGDEERLSRPVFVSYATADAKQAISVCRGIEQRGTRCWISSRDVAPGDNYQEAIVRSIRNSRAMVLVFSKAANNSDEIKKELSIASKYKVPVLALRTEDVEPSDAFAYELSTRQWIDAFAGWDKSIDALVARISSMSDDPAVAAPASTRPVHRGIRSRRRDVSMVVAAGLVLLVVVVGAVWWTLGPSRAAAHPMTVRLAGFQQLSPELPASLSGTFGSEMAAAFNEDGVVGVSTAAAPPPGTAPAYALDGTIHRVGDSIRVITRFTNDRTGAILWSNSLDFAADQLPKIPRKVAADTGTVVRCGLSGASTYRKPLPDDVLSNYMKYCQQTWDFAGTKTLLFAKRVVAALPDFSWGWSAVQTGYMQAAFLEPDSQRAKALRAAGLQAADRALALDPKNSEALDRKTYLIDEHDWLAQERLYRSAIAAKPLDCGCEHFGYGLMLTKVGRIRDSVEQQTAATDMLALWPDSQLALANALLAADRAAEAKPHFAAAIDLTKNAIFEQWVKAAEGTEIGEYATAVTAISNPRFEIAEESRAALLSAYRALMSGDPQAKVRAIGGLLALPSDQQGDTVATLLMRLGAHREALNIARERPWLFWRRSMRGLLDEPEFPAIAQQLGLMTYWKTTHTKPDICLDKKAPPFCRMI